VPDPTVPAQFYIANAAGAVSRGVELEVNARIGDGVDLFSAIGYTRATFKEGSLSGGADVSGNLVSNTPKYTTTLGALMSRPFRAGTTVYGRAEVVLYGSLHYDDLNTAQQAAYSVANVRAGIRGPNLFVEGWVRNAFDTRYIPVALPFDRQLAPSGFLGEMGAPRTFGVSSGLTF
jgi:iron complex outermembrane recepter protein